MPYKIAHQYLYTETVYYDDNDVEVGRERMYDDHLWGTLLPEPLEDWEIDQYVDEED